MAKSQRIDTFYSHLSSHLLNHLVIFLVITTAEGRVGKRPNHAGDRNIRTP